MQIYERVNLTDVLHSTLHHCRAKDRLGLVLEHPSHQTSSNRCFFRKMMWRRPRFLALSQNMRISLIFLQKAICNGHFLLKVLRHATFSVYSVHFIFGHNFWLAWATEVVHLSGTLRVSPETEEACTFCSGTAHLFTMLSNFYVVNSAVVSDFPSILEAFGAAAQIFEPSIKVCEDMVILGIAGNLQRDHFLIVYFVPIRKIQKWIFQCVFGNEGSTDSHLWNGRGGNFFPTLVEYIFTTWHWVTNHRWAQSLANFSLFILTLFIIKYVHIVENDYMSDIVRSHFKGDSEQGAILALTKNYEESLQRIQEALGWKVWLSNLFESLQRFFNVHWQESKAVIVRCEGGFPLLMRQTHGDWNHRSRKLAPVNIYI